MAVQRRFSTNNNTYKAANDTYKAVNDTYEDAVKAEIELEDVADVMSFCRFSSW